MKKSELTASTRLDPALGAEISFHAIAWRENTRPSAIPSGGHVLYHQLPPEGSMLHSHEHPEIIVVISGRIMHRVNGEKQLLETGALVFIRPDDAHQFLPASDLSPCEMIFLAFDLDLFVAVSNYLEDASFLQKYTEPVLSPMFHMEESRLNQLSLEMLSVNTKSFTPALRRAYIKATLVNLFVRYFLNDSNYLQADSIPEWLSQLCELMRKPENFIAGLKRMQQLSGYSPEYLCAVFRRFLDKTPTAFINELRINHAAHLLSDSNMDISTIAAKLHIKSLSRFYALFRRYYGCSPARYRRRAASHQRL
jgi:AraC family cel operon transcriptional repressor